MSNDLVSPADDVFLPAAKALREANPSLGVPKLLALLKEQNPTWSVSEKRLRKAVPPSVQPSTNGAPAGNGAAANEPGLVADTGLDPSIPVSDLAPKIKVKLFGGEKGKGLVAREKIQQGEVVWQEEPWIVTADPELYAPLLQQSMCTQCFTMFNQRNPPLSISCQKCDMAHFCNRLCLSRASESAAHHELLCPGTNPGAMDLIMHIHKNGARHLDAASKIVARWRGERTWGSAHKAEEIEKRVWGGMARVSIEAKEKERKEWEYVGELKRKEWQAAHQLLVEALNPPPESKKHKAFQKLLASKVRKPAQPPLSEAEIERWFSFEAFLQLLGIASLNQESSGGLYALHAHINHSCEPNLMARNLPKSFVAPSAEDLPCPPPPPNGPGVRGTNKLTMVARKTINPGVELTLPYVNFNMPRDDRRAMLRELYGFWCACPKCVREAPAQAAAPAEAEKKKEAAE